MTKPTGKQRVAMNKIKRRIDRAVLAATLAKTPEQQEAATAAGMKAAGKFTSLSAALKG